MANLDTRSKRASSVGIGLVFLAAPVLPDGTLALADRMHAAWSYSGIAPQAQAITPTDDDADITVTTFHDRDGYVVRAARTTVRAAADSLRDEDLANAERLDMDRHLAISNRAGRLPNVGTLHRVHLFTSRAGEAPAPRELVLFVSFDRQRGRGIRAADTANRTDRDGYTLTVPETRLRHAANSLRNADLSTGLTDQDRLVTSHGIDPARAEALIHRILLQTAGRAGECWAPRELIIYASVRGNAPVEAKSR